MMDPGDRPQVLYRFFNGGGDLLYVGISADIGMRWVDHRLGKRWWQEIATATFEHFPDRASASTAERYAITTESPRYNHVRYTTVRVSPQPQPPSGSPFSGPLHLRLLARSPTRHA